MRVLLVAAAAATALVVTSPSFAQVRIDTPGATVRFGDRDRDYDRDHYRYREHRRIYGAGECRTVTVRRSRPDGTMIVTRRRMCD